MVPSIETATAHQASGSSEAFLRHGGEMGLLTRAHDWASTAVGPPSGWPQSLRTAIRLMLTSRHPMFIWWGPELIQFYNDAYRQTMGPERHPSALGARGKECWAEIWDIIGPQIELVTRGDGATWNEDHLVPVTRHGELRQVWWTYGYSPIDEGDAVGGVLVVCKDVTEEHLSKAALATANKELFGDVVRLRALFEQAPGFVCVLQGPEHIFEFTNAAYEQLVGRGMLVGHRVIDLFPEMGSQGFVALLDGVFSTAKAHVGTSMPLALRRTPAGSTEQLYVDFVYQPICDSDGSVTGIFVEGADVTDRVVAEQRQTLLLSEMNHRVKNTLATVRAIAALSGKSATSVAEFRYDLDRRLEAMAKTNDRLILGHSGQVSIREIIEQELAPYLGGEVTLNCEAIHINDQAAISFGLLVHELLTNAAKYGALSRSGGMLSVNCTHTLDDAVLVWEESTPEFSIAHFKDGFGTHLIEVLASSLGGNIRTELQAKGVKVTLNFKCDDVSPRDM